MAKVKTATRTLSNAGRLRTLVVATSPKAVGQLGAESLVEYDGLLELIADPDIVSVEVQPQTFQFVKGGGRTVSYTPDVRFTRRDGRIGYREFKHDVTKLEPELAAKLEIARESFAEQGYEFEIRDATAIRKGFRIQNLRLLKRYAQWPVSPAFQRGVLEFVGERTDILLQDLCEPAGTGGLGGVYRMLWDHLLEADLETALFCTATRIWRPRS